MAWVPADTVATRAARRAAARHGVPPAQHEGPPKRSRGDLRRLTAAARTLQVQGLTDLLASAFHEAQRLQLLLSGDEPRHVAVDRDVALRLETCRLHLSHCLQHGNMHGLATQDF